MAEHQRRIRRVYNRTQKGVIKVRTVRTRGAHQERWKFQEFMEMIGAPWEPVPGSGYRTGIDRRECLNGMKLRIEK